MVNKEYEQEYDEKLKIWHRVATDSQQVIEKISKASEKGTTYYLTNEDGVLLEKERLASADLEKIGNKLFGLK